MNLKPPSDEEIRAAELRLQQAERDLSEGKKRAKAAVVDFVVKPATLLGIAAVAGVAGYMIFRKPKVVEVPDDWRARLSKWTKGLVPPRAPTQTETAVTTAATTTGVMGIIIALAMRYATRQLPGIGLRLFNEAMRKRGAYGTRVPPRPTPTLH